MRVIDKGKVVELSPTDVARIKAVHEPHWSEYIGAAVLRDQIRMSPAEVTDRAARRALDEAHVASCTGCQYFGKVFAHPLLSTDEDVRDAFSFVKKSFEDESKKS